MTDQPLLTVQDVADRLNVSVRWVYTRYEQGELRGGKVGRYLHFRASDIDDFVNRAFEA